MLRPAGRLLMRKLVVFASLAMFSLALVAQRGGGSGHGGGSGGHFSSGARFSTGARATGRVAPPSRAFAPARSFNYRPATSPYSAGAHRSPQYGSRRSGYGYGRRRVGYGVGYPYGYYPGFAYPGFWDSGIGWYDPDDPNNATSSGDSGDAGSYQQAYSGPPDSPYGDPNAGPYDYPQADTARPPYYPGAGGASSSDPEAPQAKVTLILRDGRRLEIQNYVATRTRILVRDAGANRDIPVSSLDIPATLAANQASGVEFSVPGSPAAASPR